MSTQESKRCVIIPPITFGAKEELHALCAEYVRMMIADDQTKIKAMDSANKHKIAYPFECVLEEISEQQEFTLTPVLVGDPRHDKRYDFPDQFYVLNTLDIKDYYALCLCHGRLPIDFVAVGKTIIEDFSYYEPHRTITKNQYHESNLEGDLLFTKSVFGLPSRERHYKEDKCDILLGTEESCINTVSYVRCVLYAYAWINMVSEVLKGLDSRNQGIWRTIPQLAEKYRCSTGKYYRTLHWIYHHMVCLVNSLLTPHKKLLKLFKEGE